MSFTVSADTGGTFIDLVVRDHENEFHFGKALTTHDRVFEGMESALSSVGEDLGLSSKEILEDTRLFIYGTTHATNAIVTRKVAKTAFLTTEGFADTLVLKEGGKRDVFDYDTEYPQPYIPRRRTFEIPERISSDAGVVTPMDEEALRNILLDLKRNDYESIAVSLLWSVINPTHELRVGELIDELLPEIPYTLSHRLAPIVREYRRASATAIDASLKPLMQQHFRQLEQDLHGFGYEGQLLVSSSLGGVLGVEEIIEAPINAAKSGPAMAPVAAATYSEVESLGGNTIVCDTGGTTFDIGLTHDSELVQTRETWIGGEWEGDLLGISSVDIRSIGSGGGSIAWVDEGGLLRVGPQSAGSEPGPACYGRGGTEATLSDAACVLGFFDPEYFLGGRMELDSSAAHSAVERVATKLGKTVAETAWGILMISSDHMVDAVHDMTISQGLNPKDSTVVAGGGAAGISILQIAAELGSERIVLPRTASVLSATGMHFANIIKEEGAPLITRSDKFAFTPVNDVLKRLTQKLHTFAKGLDLEETDYRLEYFTEARYEGQVWDILVPLPVSRIDDSDAIASILSAFHAHHDRLFGVRDEDANLEFISWKARIVAEIGATTQRSVPGPLTSGNPSRYRECYFGSSDWVRTGIFFPADLQPGTYVSGPAVIQEPTTTLVVYPGMATEISSSGNYILHISKLEGNVHS